MHKVLNQTLRRKVTLQVGNREDQHRQQDEYLNDIVNEEMDAASDPVVMSRPRPSTKTHVTRSDNHCMRNSWSFSQVSNSFNGWAFFSDQCRLSQQSKVHWELLA